MLAAFLAACGSESKPTRSPDVIATSPKSSAQIVAPASAPQATDTASTPVASSPVAPDTASLPVAASAPASSEPVASAPAPASTPVASSPTPASTPALGIVYYADDQTQGDVISAYGMLTMTSPTEPAALQGLLQSKFSDTGLTVANASTGGTSSSLPNELAGVDGGGQPAPVCDGSDPLQLQYVGVIDSVGQQLNVPVIPLYTYVQSVPDWQSHMQNCQIPDATLNQLEAQQAEKVIAPLIKTLIAE